MLVHNIGHRAKFHQILLNTYRVLRVQGEREIDKKNIFDLYNDDKVDTNY